MHMKSQGDVIYYRSTNERSTDYWIENSITDAELALLVDFILSSKILTQEESQSLAERLILLSGKELADNLIYRHRVRKQPYLGKEQNDIPVAISEVAQISIFRKTISEFMV